ncbi:anhydro-N-acetylmuramic acid kinase [Roseomonas elaeocarpi]|uniref:Anhydro-N-acetylmuramic acid kinase n=1 Tax=Roseomonas elaeocarpi TaxID=907779 RepID=A0ABV6JTT4_9PROT
MLRTIGLRCPPSLDGVEAALVETDGRVVRRVGPARRLPHPPALRRDLRAAADEPGPPPEALGRRLLDRCAEAVRTLGEAAELIGLADPAWPGEAPAPAVEAAALARRLGVPVAHGFGEADVLRGGPGAPVAPAGFGALLPGLPRPLVVLEFDGVIRMTWIGAAQETARDALVSLEAGPAGGMVEDWCRRSFGEAYDPDGRLASSGTPDGAVLARLTALPWVNQPPPRRLDRRRFEAELTAAGAAELPLLDGAATLLLFSAAATAAAARLLPGSPLQWLVTGPGRHNAGLIRAVAGVLEQPVRVIDGLGIDGDAFAAQAVAVLAARATYQLPLTFPGTTGTAVPLPGGRIETPV